MDHGRVAPPSTDHHQSKIDRPLDVASGVPVLVCDIECLIGRLDVRRSEVECLHEAAKCRVEVSPTLVSLPEIIRGRVAFSSWQRLQVALFEGTYGLDNLTFVQEQCSQIVIRDCPLSRRAQADGFAVECLERWRLRRWTLLALPAPDRESRLEDRLRRREFASPALSRSSRNFTAPDQSPLSLAARPSASCFLASAGGPSAFAHRGQIIDHVIAKKSKHEFLVMHSRVIARRLRLRAAWGAVRASLLAAHQDSPPPG